MAQSIIDCPTIQHGAMAYPISMVLHLESELAVSLAKLQTSLINKASFNFETMINKVIKSIGKLILFLICLWGALSILSILTFLFKCDRQHAPRDYELYKDTPVWKLAKAVRRNDTAMIRELVLRDSIDINFQEPEYGMSVLQTAICHTPNNDWFSPVKLATVEVLLKLGADPNLYSHPNFGKNAVILACEDNYPEGLKLLIKYGGDPNSRCVREGIYMNDNTALREAIRTYKNTNKIECVKLLWEAGANIDATSTFFPGGALEMGVTYENFKAVYFLLQKGANYNIKCKLTGSVDSLGNFILISFVEDLREHTQDLNTEGHYYKRKVIDFLKEKGLNYDSVPIPEGVAAKVKKKYPETWEQYLKEY